MQVCSRVRTYYRIGMWTRFGWEDSLHSKTIDRRIAKRRLARELRKELEEPC